MVFLQTLQIVFLGTRGTVFTILAILTVIGFLGMFKKSRINPLWALCPWVREYMLAKCAAREPEGRVVAVLSFFDSLAMLMELYTPSESRGTLLYALVAVDLLLKVIMLIYRIRVYSGLIEVYGVRGRWMWLLIIIDTIPALVFGYSRKYGPRYYVEDIENDAIDTVSGVKKVSMGEGLTVNLEERAVRQFFQKKVLLKDIHLDIKPGHMVLLLGGSGAGKTTLITAINGYEKAKADVDLNGHDVYDEYKKMLYQIGYVPQQDLMRGKDTVISTLNDAATLRLPQDLPEQDRKARVEEVLSLFALSKSRNSLVEKLSGGQKKRLSIALEYVSNPALFILDEPDSGLDGVMARELMQNLRAIADQGKIIIVITHTPDRVIDLFDDVIVLAKDSAKTGRLAFFGSIEEAKGFFGRDSMEHIVKSINSVEEGGDGLADEFVLKFTNKQKLEVANA